MYTDRWCARMRLPALSLLTPADLQLDAEKLHPEASRALWVTGRESIEGSERCGTSQDISGGVPPNSRSLALPETRVSRCGRLHSCSGRSTAAWARRTPDSRIAKAKQKRAWRGRARSGLARCESVSGARNGRCFAGMQERQAGGCRSVCCCAGRSSQRMQRGQTECWGRRTSVSRNECSGCRAWVADPVARTGAQSGCSVVGVC